MIQRFLPNLINQPFDFFNDYTNTHNYLINQGYTSLALHLERRKEKYDRHHSTGNNRRTSQTKMDTRE
jgi:hypothetical protein